MYVNPEDINIGMLKKLISMHSDDFARSNAEISEHMVKNAVMGLSWTNVFELEDSLADNLKVYWENKGFVVEKIYPFNPTVKTVSLKIMIPGFPKQ